MKCPYCHKEIEPIDMITVSFEYGCDDTYHDIYNVDCPICNKTFRLIENYIRTEDTIKKLM